MYNPDADRDEVWEADQFFSNMLDALVEASKATQTLLDYRDFHGIMEAIGDTLVQHTNAARDRLNDALEDSGGRSGIQDSQLVDREYEALKEHFRAKRRPVPCNPATPGFPGGEAA